MSSPVDRDMDDAIAPQAPAPVEPERTSRSWRRPLLVGLLMITATVAVGVGLFAFSYFYGEYGAVKNGPDALEWAAQRPLYAGAPACVTCHAPEAGYQDASIHVNVSCESCHGPGAAHAENNAAAAAHPLEAPESAICITCHGATGGRPAGFAVIDPVEHYGKGGECLRCHDPHSISANRPPMINHPLTSLPACTTCHAPDGLKKVPAGHTEAPDTICLTCHEPEIFLPLRTMEPQP